MNIDQIKKQNKAAGYHWFEADTMRFFGTRIESDVVYGTGGIFFVSSEQPPHGPRVYVVRRFDPRTGSVQTHGEGVGLLENAHLTRDHAYTAALRAAHPEDSHLLD